MTTPSFTAEDVALFLQENPGFFQDHSELFANIRVPHPHETRAISLGERQILTLRAKTKDLEWKLASLMQNAMGNEKISHTLTAWCCRMLAEPEPSRLPAHVVRSLCDLFDLPTVALRLWDLPGLEESEFGQDVTSSIRDFASTLTTPYCGPWQDQEAGQWLPEPPRSLAIVALRASTPGYGSESSTCGLLVLGSDDPERFTPDMGTAFLQTIGELAGAALSRLATSECIAAVQP